MIDPALLEIRKIVIPELVFGIGSRFRVGQYAENLALQKPLVVTDEGLLSTPWIEDVLINLSEYHLAPVVFSNVSPNPRDYEVMEGAALYSEAKCDSIIAIGGGSPMDCAKGIGIVVSNGRNILDYEGVDQVSLPCPPLLCIPTTAGSSADVSQFAIVNDTIRKVKIAIVSKAMIPDMAFVDAEVTTTMPPELTAYTGLDALTHAIEAYCSNAHSPITDLHALEAVRLISKWLVAAINNPDDLVARSKIMLGSMYAGFAFSNAILGAVHAMAHSLGGLLDLPHGLCNAILLNHVVAYNFDSFPDRSMQLAEALGVDAAGVSSSDEVKKRLLERIVQIKRDAGVTIKLGDVGVKREHLAQLAVHALDDACILTNPKDAKLEDLIRIYEQAL